MNANSKVPQFILASSSPRRRELLTEAGYDFIVASPPMPEPEELARSLTPAQQAEALAYFKARSVFEAFSPTVPVLGADTVVALGGRVFGKPDNLLHAKEILSTLSGTRQAVITGVALLCPEGDRLIASQTTWVTMRKISDSELDAYLATGAWEGKAGAYGVQDLGDAFVESIEGSFSNVVGLPLEMVQDLFMQMLARKNRRGGVA